jgi:ATP-dependent protease ClpP protease subunit
VPLRTMPEKPLVYCRRAPEGVVEIPILGAIGETVNAEDIIRDLMMFRPTEVKFIIYSPGGMAFDAIALVGYLNEKGIKSYTEIYGICASAATMLAAHSGKSRTAMAPGSQFMIHNGSGFIKKLVEDVNDFAVDLYRDAYGWDRKAVRSFMEANDGEGTFWNAEEAKKAGICSEVMSNARVAAHLNNEQPQRMQVKGKLVSLVAVKGQEVEFEFDPTAELKDASEALATATADRIAAETKEKDATDKVAALETKVSELQEANKSLDEVTAKLTDEQAKTTALNTEVEALKARNEKLEKLPTAKALDLSGDGKAVDPAEEGKNNLTQGEAIVKTAMASANPLQLAQAKMEAEKAAKK